MREYNLFREQSQQPIMVAGLLKTRESEGSPSCGKSPSLLLSSGETMEVRDG